MGRLRFDQLGYTLAIAAVIVGGVLVGIGRWIETIDLAHDVEDDPHLGDPFQRVSHFDFEAENHPSVHLEPAPPDDCEHW